MHLPPVTLYTIGYEMRPLDAYVGLLLEAGVGVVVDVRETAWSYKSGFSKVPLERALQEAGIAYTHARFAGNPKAIRAGALTHEACLLAYQQHLTRTPHVIGALNTMLTAWAARGVSAALTCYERHPYDCHRSILAERWRADSPGREIVHLGPDGCSRRAPRFVPWCDRDLEQAELRYALRVPEPHGQKCGAMALHVAQEQMEIALA